VPQIEKPIGGEVVSELEHLRVIAPELLTHAPGQTIAFLLQVVGHPRPLAQLHNHWLVIRQTPKGVPIGAQAVAQHVSVAPVVLGAGHGEAIAEPIDLLGIDPVDAKTAFQQGLYYGAMRRFDCHPDYLGRGAGAGNQPIAQLLDPRAAMRNGSFPQALSMGIDQANLMALARPVDAHKPFHLFRHAEALSRITHIRAAATSVNPCTGARSATSHGTSVAADLPGCRSAPGAQNTGILGQLPAGRPGPTSLQCRPVNGRQKGTGIPTLARAWRRRSWHSITAVRCRARPCAVG
jgi:hypothetical protein